MEQHSSSSARSDGAAKSSVEGSKHTPGPWAVLELRDTDRCLVSSNCLPDGSERAAAEKNGGFMVAHTLGPQREANARLIAAAPDLLAQCREARDFLIATHQNLTNGEWSDYGAMELDAQLAAAIAKATSPADTASPSAETDRTS